MSTIKSSNEHLTFNADGTSKEIRFQANGTQKASISSAGLFTSTTIDATKLTGDLPAISGASLTNLPSAAADGFFATSGLSSKDLGQGLHIKTGDSGLGSINSNFSQLVVEGNTTAGISILTSTTHEGVLAFSDSGGHRGLVRYAHANDALSFATADVDRLTIASDGSITNEGGVYKLGALTTAGITAGWNFDSSGATNISLTQGSSSAITTSLNGSGMILVNDTSLTGETAIFVTGGGQMDLIGGTSTSFVNSSSPSSSQIGLYVSGGKAYVKNGINGTLSLNMQTFRTRSGQ